MSRTPKKKPTLEARITALLKKHGKEADARDAALRKAFGNVVNTVNDVLEQAEEIKDDLEDLCGRIDRGTDEYNNLTLSVNALSDDNRKMHRRMGAVRDVLLTLLPKKEKK